MECASICTLNYFCSAFRFDQSGQICEIGAMENLDPMTPTELALMQLYVKLDFEDLGNYNFTEECSILHLS